MPCKLFEDQIKYLALINIIAFLRKRKGFRWPEENEQLFKNPFFEVTCKSSWCKSRG